MTDLNKMWEALARYQSYADKDGHGDSWRVMCSERTREAAWAAAERAARAAYVAAWPAAAWAAAEAAAFAEYWSELAIKHIEQAIKERNDE